MQLTANETRDGARSDGLIPARLARRFRAPCVFLVAPGGAGKTTLLRRVARSAEHALSLSLGVEDRDPASLDAMLDVADAQEATTIAIDDAQLVYGTAGEAALRRLISHADAHRHFVLASRLPPAADLLGAPQDDVDVVTAPELALRIDEIADVFHHVGGHHLGLECASRVASETGGWAGLVHLLAALARRADPDAMEALVEVTLRGDFAAPLLEDALRSLPRSAACALEETSGLASIEFGECLRLLGADAATELLGILDGGAVMHAVDRGRRVVPPVLRRHLRARAGLPSEELPPTASEADDELAGIASTVAKAAKGANGPAGPHTPHAPDAFDAALSRLRNGDVVAAVPLLQRVLHREGAPNQATARLLLLVIRESIAPRETTLDALAALERECVSEGLGRLARVVRGAIAAASGLPERVAQGVVDECELRDDDQAAALVAGIDFLVRIRHGRASSMQATALAQRLDHLAIPDAAVWARASGALLAAASGSAQTRELIADAETASIATRHEGARALIEAARGFGGPAEWSAERLASSRRLALHTGLPRLPSALPRHAPASASSPSQPSAHLDPRRPHLTVGCFGGFHLRTDGVEVDLRAVRPQARALLRMLALNSGAPLHRELIADILWGDLGTESAVHALHVSVSSLRRALPAELAGPAGSLVERVGEAYRLGIVERRDCDLADFDDRLADAATAKARRDAPTTADGLRGALDLYVGDVLPEDGPAEWVTGARERYRVRAAEAASSLAHLELHLGEPRAAVAAASRAVEIDPWLDESWRTLVTVHRSSGDVVAAQRAAEGYRRMRVALGIE